MSFDIQSIFKNKKLNKEKLLNFGFAEQENIFCKNFSVLNGEFTMFVSVNINGTVKYKVIENITNEEYALVHIQTIQGGFAEKVRNACRERLEEISQKCFDFDIFKNRQTKKIINFIKNEYSIEPEFLWKKFPNYAVFRRKDNEKWFAIIMTVDKNKIGLSETGDIEIINLKASPDIVEKYLKEKNFYPAYHMNKKHWFTISLDESISDEKIFKMLSDSYINNKNK